MTDTWPRPEWLRQQLAAHTAGGGNFEQYRADPVAFCADVLGFRPWSRQADVLSLLATSKRVAVRSGHKVGKSRLDAAAALWWAYTQPRARVILTSSGNRQVKTILWRELRTLHRAARLPGVCALDPGTGLRLPDGREILGFTTQDAERMAGQSGDQLFFIIDEASGYPQPIWEAIQGNLAGGGRVLCTGNPTRPAGFFFDAFHASAELWDGVHISSEETPNVTGEGEPVPGLATREWLEDMLKEYGQVSPIIDVRVRGNFADSSEDAVIPLAMLTEAQKRHAAAEPSGQLRIGVDVARFGDDDSVIWPVRGAYAYAPIVIHGYDTVEVAGRVMEVADRLRIGDERPIIQVDSIGYGAGVVDVLKRRNTVRTIGINVAERSDQPDKFRILRDQLWWGIRTWLSEGGSLPKDSTTDAELLNARYGYDVRGRVQVDPKDKMRTHLGRSPDRADALALAVYTGGAPTRAGKRARRGSEARNFGRLL
mgnify:CR=1 FL=1